MRSPFSGRAWMRAGTLLLALTFTAGASIAASHQDTALQAAQFLLRLQNADGGIPDKPGGDRVNEDSNMEYALIGFGAAYQATGDHRYLQALEKGIRWLAAREEMTDSFWRGSWRLVYSSIPPYAPVPAPPGAGVVDARGVGATSALFVYLIHLHQRLSGQTSLAVELAANAKAALDFVIARNRAADGFFYSSWQQARPGGPWQLWPYQYSADQGDVYLGMRAGGLLYDDPAHRYHAIADFLQNNAPTRFFNKRAQRYGLGRDTDSSLDMSFDGFDGIFPQGYLPWIWGNIPQNAAAYGWLKSKAAADGSIVNGAGPVYTLGAAVTLMAAEGIAVDPNPATRSWLVAVPYDPKSGGFRDTASVSSPLYSNVAGLSIIGLLGFRAF